MRPMLEFFPTSCEARATKNPASFGIGRIGTRNGRAGLAVVDGEEADVGVLDLACDAGAELGADDVARVQQSDGRGEVVGIFEKEGTQFGEVDGISAG